ncbi:Urease operon accessory protein [Rhizobium sp. L1K21]|uniref:Urease operon accessory protein n=1 Tax=Rhizobium sp. L1K21 TaxID=2954933 RepID=UPI0020932E75|nr:Urease operon accessory protein [Rhizobium sp. L1K21]MCO6185320.1 Urease operon accessory protein [Rhizobium sp. L1K21]
MGQRIAIFGNGALGQAAMLAYEVDLVIRFNDCRSAGADAKRTDVVAVCNTGRPAKAMVLNAAWRESEAVRAAKEIYCVRPPERYERMRASLAITHPELDDFCDDYTEAFEAFARETGKTFRTGSLELHQRLEDELTQLGAANFVSPSSGLLLMADVLENRAQPGDDVVLGGFSHEGWDLHPWDAERRWVDAHAANGRLRRADPFYPIPTYQEPEIHAL